MVDRLVAVDDADYRLPEPVLGALLSGADLNATIGAGVRAEAVPLDRVDTLMRTPDVRSYVSASDSVQRLQVPSHISDQFQATHPSVKFFPQGWNGWRYWMAFTPYPDSDAAHEDPCIAVSQDGKSWTTPEGFSNPLDDAPDALHYNADTELAISPDGTTLYCMWRYADAVTRVVQFKVRSTTDGVNWTTAVVAMTHPDYNVANYVSPTLVHDGTQWVMWAVNIAVNPNKFVRLTSPAVTGPWSAATDCTATPDAARDFWHVSVIATVGGYVALMTDTPLNQNGGNGDLFLMTSTDGLTWTRGWPLFERPFGTEYTGLYRGTLIATETGFDVWFGAHDADFKWGVFRAQVKSDPALQSSVSKWIPAWEFRPPTAGASEGVVVSMINGWLLDPTTAESVATTVTMPGWKRFAAELWFSTTNASAGNVVLSLNYLHLTDGAVMASPPIVNGTPTVTPGGEGRVHKSTVISSLLVQSDRPWYFRVLRLAHAAEDTLAADVLFLGMRLVRVA